VLLGSEATEAPTLSLTLGRWTIAYVVIVSLLGLGGCIGIRLGPTPKIRRSGRSSDLHPPIMPDVESAGSSEGST